MCVLYVYLHCIHTFCTFLVIFIYLLFVYLESVSCLYIKKKKKGHVSNWNVVCNQNYF